MSPHIREAYGINTESVMRVIYKEVYSHAEKLYMIYYYTTSDVRAGDSVFCV